MPGWRDVVLVRAPAVRQGMAGWRAADRARRL